jgi:hypothetical protein
MYDSEQDELWHPKPKPRKKRKANKPPLDTRTFVKLMAEAVPLMKVTDRQRELIKAGLRFCITHACERLK